MSEAAGANGGQVIDGRYLVVGKIAEGGMASVYEAIDQRLSRHVAVKVMHTQLAQGPHREQFEERFRREARSAAAIANPHIVQVYDTGQYQGLDYLVMEYVHGVNLRREMNEQGTFSVKETLRITAEILDGLASAHRAGVIHRDIKPENILINDRGHVEITDFGLARAASQATLSTTGMLLGTAAYLAPETIENNLATPRSDLYAVGILAYEMLTGDVPFTSENPVTIVFKHVHQDVPSLVATCPGINPEISHFIDRLVSRDPGERPEDAAAALKELEDVRADLSQSDLSFRQARRGDREGGSEDRYPTGPSTPPALAGAANPPLTSAGQTEDGAAPDRVTLMQGSAPDKTGTSAMTRTMPGGAGSGSDTRRYALTTHGGPSSADQTQVIQPGRDLPGSVPQADSQPPAPWNRERGADRPADALIPAGQTTAKKKRHLLPLILVLVILLVAGVGGGSWWYFLGPGSYLTLPRPDDISCKTGSPCSLAGADFSRYRSTLKVAGIEVKTTYVFDDNQPKGKIVSSDPDQVGAKITKRGGRLSVSVSKGPRQATIPSDILKADTDNGRDPLAALKRVGFDRVIHQSAEDEYSMDVPEGAAISVDPAPGTTARHDSEVRVRLSKGKMPVTMPDIVGQTRENADAALKAVHLKAEYKEDWSDKVEAGKVISSSQPADADLHWGDQVEVTVSKGPQTVVMPKVEGKSQDEATRILKGLGLEVKISAPLGNFTHTVRFQDPPAGTKVQVLNGNGDPSVVTLTVV